MSLKSEDFLYIEKCISTVKAGIDIDDNLNKVADTLNRVFDLDVKINFINNNSGNFFGVNVFPDAYTLERITSVVLRNRCTSEQVVNQWYENRSWIIEIDSILLSEYGLNASPSEVTAFILHELGTVVFYDKVPVKFTNIVRQHVVGLSYTLKTLARDNKISKLFQFALLEACSTKNFRFENIYNDVSTEEYLSENEFMYKQGYQKDYENFIHKLIDTFNNTLVDRTEEDINKDIRSIVNWCITNIKQLEIRKQSLRLALKTEMLKTPSNYIKYTVQHIYRAFFGSVLDEYRVLLSEAYMEEPRDVYGEMLAEQCLTNHVNRVLEESAKNIWDRKGNLKKITQADIDILFVEAQKIETIDDKLYLLDKLYSQMELVDAALDYIRSNDRQLSSKVTQSKMTLEGFKKQLNEIRENILAVKIIDKQYGVFVKVPVGYRG